MEVWVLYGDDIESNADLAHEARRFLSQGEKMAVKLNSPEAIAAYENGKQFYWARRGQMNMSCATTRCSSVSSAGAPALLRHLSMIRI